MKNQYTKNKFKVGDEFYSIFNDKLHKDKVEYNNQWNENMIFKTKEELFEYLENNLVDNTK